MCNYGGPIFLLLHLSSRTHRRTDTDAHIPIPIFNFCFSKRWYYMIHFSTFYPLSGNGFCFIQLYIHIPWKFNLSANISSIGWVCVCVCCFFQLYLFPQPSGNFLFLFFVFLCNFFLVFPQYILNKLLRFGLVLLMLFLALSAAVRISYLVLLAR